MNRRSESSLSWISGVAGIAIGACAMYFSDPDRGRRRRALVRDQVQHWSREAACALNVAARDFGNRLQGMRARTKHMLSRSVPVADVVVEERVRARLGRATTHPRAIKVMVQEGHVNLSGTVLAHERDDVVEIASATPGVAAVSENLQVHESAEHIPSLQGNHALPKRQSSFKMEEWSPSTRALAAIGGCTLGCYGLFRRSPVNVALAAFGLGLMATGALNNARPSRRQHQREAGSHRPVPSGERGEEGGILREPGAREATREPAAQPHATTPEPGTLLH